MIAFSRAVALLSVFAVVALAYRWDPGYPRMVGFPTSINEFVTINGSGIAYSMRNVRGPYVLVYTVANQAGRNAKFTVKLLNESNFRSFDRGGPYDCINWQQSQCTLSGVVPKTGSFSGLLYRPENLYLVVTNDNLIYPANLQVGLTVSPVANPPPFNATPTWRFAHAVKATYDSN